MAAMLAVTAQPKLLLGLLVADLVKLSQSWPHLGPLAS